MAERLLDDALADDLSLSFTLLNGDDFFGRFYGDAIMKRYAINRCDASISRFNVDVDGKLYPCPALASYQDGEIASPSPTEAFEGQIMNCIGCPYKQHCGGGCPSEIQRTGQTDVAHCLFKQHLILLAHLLALTIEKESPLAYRKLTEFMEEKGRRYRKDAELAAYLKKHPYFSFTEGKKAFDKEHRRY